MGLEQRETLIRALALVSQPRVRLLSEPIEKTGIPQGRLGCHLYAERTLWTLNISGLISDVSYETPAVPAPADLEETCMTAFVQ